MSLTEFLRSHQIAVLQVQVVNWEERTGLIKVCQVLQETSLVSKGQYNVLTLQPTLTLKTFMELKTLLLSILTPYVCIIVGMRGQESVE